MNQRKDAGFSVFTLLLIFHRPSGGAAERSAYVATCPKAYTYKPGFCVKAPRDGNFCHDALATHLLWSVL